MAHERYLPGVIGEQLRAHPIHRGRVIGANHQAEIERVGRERSISLPGNHRVGDVDHAALNLIAHRAIGPPVKQNAIQIEARPPDRVVAGPGAVHADAVAASAGGPHQQRETKMPQHPARIRSSHVLAIADVFERAL